MFHLRRSVKNTILNFCYLTKRKFLSAEEAIHNRVMLRHKSQTSHFKMTDKDSEGPALMGLFGEDSRIERIYTITHDERGRVVVDAMKWTNMKTAYSFELKIDHLNQTVTMKDGEKHYEGDLKTGIFSGPRGSPSPRGAARYRKLSRAFGVAIKAVEKLPVEKPLRSPLREGWAMISAQIYKEHFHFK